MAEPVHPQPLNGSGVGLYVATRHQTLRLLSASWLRCRTRSSRQKVRLVQPGLKPRVIRSARRLGARLVKSLRRVVVRSFASIERPTAVPTRPTTPWTAVAMTAMASPLRQQQVSPLSPRSPTRSLGAIRAWPLCRPCSRLM